MTVRTRMVLIGVVGPLTISLVGVILVVLVLPELPNPIAVHWNVEGMPDGFGSPIGFPILLLAVGLGWAAFTWAIARTLPPTGKPTVNQRLILAIGYFLATVLTVTLAGSVLIQRGLADARDTLTIMPLLLGGFAGGILLSVIAWFLLPRSAPDVAADPADLPALSLSDTERGTWMQNIAPRRAVAGLVITVMVIVVSVGCGVLWFVAPVPVFALYAVLMVTLTVLVVGSLYWKVRVDGRGFHALSMIGFPRFTIALEDVASADVIEVRAARDFGGWGVRWGGKRRLGIITRSGEALEVRRKDGRALVVTVSQAATGAALLNSLAQRVE